MVNNLRRGLVTWICALSIASGSWDEWNQSRKIKILHPSNWGLVKELPLLLRVDASAFYDIWHNQGLTLSLVIGAEIFEVESWNATFRIEGPM